MAKVPAAAKTESHTAPRPKRIGFSVETVKTAQVKNVPNLEVDQKDVKGRSQATVLTRPVAPGATGHPFKP